jgi:hypothetical protein
MLFRHGGTRNRFSIGSGAATDETVHYLLISIEGIPMTPDEAIADATNPAKSAAAKQKRAEASSKATELSAKLTRRLGEVARRRDP